MLAQIPILDVQYVVGSGPFDTTTYAFAEVAPACNLGLVTTVTGLPGFATHTIADSLSGSFRVETASFADAGTYSVTVTSKLNLTPVEFTFYTN